MKRPATPLSDPGACAGCAQLDAERLERQFTQRMLEFERLRAAAAAAEQRRLARAVIGIAVVGTVAAVVVPLLLGGGL